MLEFRNLRDFSAQRLKYIYSLLCFFQFRKKIILDGTFKFAELNRGSVRMTNPKGSSSNGRVAWSGIWLESAVLVLKRDRFLKNADRKLNRIVSYAQLLARVYQSGGSTIGKA